MAPVIQNGTLALIGGAPFEMTQQQFEDCCCIEYGDDCQFCDAGLTPKYFTATLSGINAGVHVGCLTCVVEGGTARSFDSSVVTIDGVHLLTQTANPCIWEVTGVGAWSHTKWNNTDCTNKVADWSGTCTITLERTEAGWELTISANGFENTTGNIFTDTVAETVDDDCINVAAMANANASPWCEGDTAYHVLTDTGSATFEAGDQT